MFKIFDNINISEKQNILQTKISNIIIILIDAVQI